MRRLRKKVAKILRLYKQIVKKCCQFGWPQAKVNFERRRDCKIPEKQGSYLEREGVSCHVKLGCVGAVCFWWILSV